MRKPHSWGVQASSLTVVEALTVFKVRASGTGPLAEAPGRAAFLASHDWRSILLGSLTFVMLALIFLGSIHLGMAETEVGTLTFFALVGAILALILVNRSFDTSLSHALTRGNTALRNLFAALVFIAVIILLVPAVRALLKFGPLHVRDLAVVGGAVALLLIMLEGSKNFSTFQHNSERPAEQSIICSATTCIRPRRKSELRRPN